MVGSHLPGAFERGWFCHNGLFFRFKAKGERNMETATVNSETIERYLELSSKITRLHVKNVWADYDKEADVLYLSFRKPQRAKKTVEMGDDVLIRSDGDEVVGITVLNAGSRGGQRTEG